MVQPRVSAVVTAFNGAPFVADAIESVLGQTRPVDEVVVVDDGSTDDTAAIVKRYRSRGVRLVQQENLGVSQARNRGISATSGDLLAFLDCDDLWVPEKTELQVQHLIEKDDVGLVTCDVWWWDVAADKCSVRHLPIGWTQTSIRRRLAIRNYLGNASGIMVRRRVLNRVGVFDPAEIWAEDWEMWRRIATQSRISIIRRPLMVYRTVPTSLTNQRLGERADAYYALARGYIQSENIFWRPILILHALGWREFFRTIHARDRKARWPYVWHAWLAFWCWPFEETGSKLRAIARAVFGERFYAAYKLLVRAAIRATHYRRRAATSALPPTGAEQGRVR